MVSLSLHSLIYNALNHPDLEITPSPEDIQLILSQLSDDLKLVVVVPLPQVLVFDSDEDDDILEIPNTFIMPHIHVGGPTRFLIVMVTRGSDGRRFVERVAHQVGVDGLVIHHIDLDSGVNMDVNADLLFLVNDGLPQFVEFVQQLRGQTKMTIINMMTVNYFINLFDLIALVKPYQMWKALLLHHPQLVTKCTNFIEMELSGTSQLMVALTLALVYHQLITTTKPNYQELEGQFKRELTMLTLAVDPLQILGKFTTIKWMYHALKRILSGLDGGRLWMMASFTLGIGLGMGLALGAALMLGFYVYELVMTVMGLVPDTTPPPLPRPPPKQLSTMVMEWVRGGWQKFIFIMSRV